MTRKRALVTGGSGTLGAAICHRLAHAGYAVAILAHHHRPAAEEVAAHIHADGGIAEVVTCDVTDAESTRSILTKLLESGPIQILVNNAGIHDDATMAGMTAHQWTGVIAVSLHGFFNVTQPLLMPMIGTRWGRIITVSSVSGLVGRRGQTNYAAAKAGLHGATKSLAMEVASRGITVNVVAPGIIESPMVQDAFPPDQIEALVPMKRSGTPEEVASLVNYLASEEAGYITGQIIGVNGGLA